jgi:hypothetical protein
MISIGNFKVKDFLLKKFYIGFQYMDISYFDTSNILPNFDSKQIGRVSYLAKSNG